ncbi:tRNA pseudouridine synthase a [Anaeramoeba flamelloides]|uniref:tRNA pseudouridine synthase a n=1 Tax=Anaeramoeba flamelloides TaxID=1746091 RepID=A0ABQ8YMB2_9EUKA|nr:tRNA pseudouridine synthase a [Anaeramoeba flamelloides]
MGNFWYTSEIEKTNTTKNKKNSKTKLVNNEKEKKMKEKQEENKRKNRNRKRKAKKKRKKNVPEWRKRRFPSYPEHNNESQVKNSNSGSSKATKDSSQELKRKRINTNKNNKNQEKKAPKRRVAVIFGYLGTGYHGLQIQYGGQNVIETIELELVNAFAKIGAISEENKVDIKKVGWSRAGRTDKGVHAARQCVVFKMAMIDTEKKIVELVNSVLPKDIRVWGIQRVTRTFNAQRRCDYRKYQFLLPTFLLTEKSIPSIEEEETTIEEKRLRFENFTDEALKFYNEKVLSKFIGTNNYHNYTKGKTYNNPKSMRYITKMVANKPITLNEKQWILIEITGQSFMIHQIRKMITMSIGVMRGCITLEQFEDSFTESKYLIPIIPGFGLLLDRAVYETYNNLKITQERGTIHFNHMNQEIENFKINHIFSHIAEVEKNENQFYDWLKTLYKRAIIKVEIN